MSIAIEDTKAGAEVVTAWWQDRIPRDGETEQEAIARLHQKPGYGGSFEDARCAVWDAMDFARRPDNLPAPAIGAKQVDIAARFARLHGICERIRWDDIGIPAMGDQRTTTAMADLAEYLFSAGVDAAISSPTPPPAKGIAPPRSIIDVHAEMQAENTRLREELDAMKAERDAAETIIGNLMTLIVNADGWVRTGHSECAFRALQAAMVDGWAAMGWKPYLDARRALANKEKPNHG